MSIVSEYIEFKVSMKNIEWLKNKGYKCNLKDIIKVYWEDLPPFSKKEIKIRCDYCNIEFKRMYSVHKNSTSKIELDACRDCRGIKTKQSNMLTYGVDNVAKLSEVREKIVNTNIKRYGTEAPLQNKNIVEKLKKTNNELYGGNSPCSSDYILEKIKKTNMDRYGDSCVLRLDSIKNKIKKTNLKKYGYENPSQSPIIREKINNSFIKNSTMSTSSQQLRIHKLVGGELNYNISKCFLDIAFPKEKIYLEYDGGGHNLSVKLGNISQEEFNKKERNRYFLLKDFGYKEIRLLCDSDKLPADEILKYLVNYSKSVLKNKNYNSIRINIDSSEISINYKEWIDFDMEGGNLHEFINSTS